MIDAQQPSTRMIQTTSDVGKPAGRDASECALTQSTGYGLIASAPPRGGRSRMTYLRHALANPFNLFMLSSAVALSLLGGQLWLLPLVFASEVVALTVVPRLNLFRAAVDEKCEQTERATLARKREALLIQMSETHRQQLEKLLLLVESIRDNMTRHGMAGELMFSEVYGLDTLIANYIRLAIAHRERTSFLALVDRESIEADIAALERRQRDDPSGHLSDLLERRLYIARKRLEHLTRTRGNLEIIAHQMATIAELIHLLHAQSVTPFVSPEMSDEVDRIMGDLKESEKAMRELDDLCTEWQAQSSAPAGKLLPLVRSEETP